MINPDKRKAIQVLFEEGMSIRKIAGQLNLSRNTVTNIIKSCVNNEPRTTKKIIDPDLLHKLYAECNGWGQRVFEKLTLEYNVEISYPTLMRRLREFNISVKEKQRCDHVADQAGEEMQQDTSDYKILVGQQHLKVVASLLYFRYSKMRYLKFYRSYNRFKMKCFFWEALNYFKYVAKTCIIDNTHLAVLRGTGSDAVFVPEMVAFARNFGFQWKAHRIKHSNRKAGNERGFWTITTNFLSGRKFDSIEDLNKQAFEWSTQLFARRPQSKTGLIPIELFEKEKPFLKKIPSYVVKPYVQHTRGIDEYGYISFQTNHYWVPGSSRFEVIVLEYADTIQIYKNRKHLIEYTLPKSNVKYEKFKPQGIVTEPHYPQQLKQKLVKKEEDKLYEISTEVKDYVQWAKKQVTQKYQFIHRLYRLQQQLSASLFIKSVMRAHKYKITNINSIEQIAIQLINLESYQLPLMNECINDELTSRNTYQNGLYADESDLSEYDQLLNNEENDKSDEDK